MNLKLGDAQTTARIPLAVKVNETLRKNTRINDNKVIYRQNEEKGKVSE